MISWTHLKFCCLSQLVHENTASRKHNFVFSPSLTSPVFDSFSSAPETGGWGRGWFNANWPVGEFQAEQRVGADTALQQPVFHYFARTASWWLQCRQLIWCKEGQDGDDGNDDEDEKAFRDQHQQQQQWRAAAGSNNRSFSALTSAIAAARSCWGGF